MGMFVNSGNLAFQAAVSSEIYIDKTGLLNYTNKVLDTLQNCICNSRPRRFGKSVTAAMLTAYYSRGCHSEELFSGLEIENSADFRKHLNQYDVIHLDIQWCMEPAGGPDQVISYITEHTIGELRTFYPNELPEGVHSLPEALSRINSSSGQKFIIIIDEWDVLIRDELADKKVQDDYIRFLRALFKGTEPSKYLRLAYLTGILPIKKEKTQSALNNFDEFTMLDAGNLAPYIGFTEQEVQKLCIKYQQDFDKVRKWYDGYLLDHESVYNPRAVVSVMLRKRFQSYWSETASYEAILPFISLNYDGLKTALIEMLSGASVKVNTGSFRNDTANIQSKDDVLTYLIHLGYLGYDQDSCSAFVPNEEIRQELAAAVESRNWNEMITFQQESEKLLDAALDMDAETVAEQIEKLHTEYASAIQYNNESSLSSVLAIGYLSAMQYYFKPIRELPTGRGFADFVFLPKPEYRNDYPALVIELKWNQSVHTAIQQIRDRNYPASILNYTGNVLLVGISYSKTDKKHHCQIEQWRK